MKLKEIEEKVKDVQCLNTKEERAAFYKYASKVPDNGIIVDIGTAAGGSAFVLAFASKPSVKVLTVDPSRSEKFLYSLEKFELWNKVFYFEQTSESVAEEMNRKIDMLFIDGVHSYKGVTKDFNLYKVHMVKGGIVMFHDYYLYRDFVGKVVDEIVARGELEKVEIVDSIYKDEVRTGLYISRVI